MNSNEKIKKLVLQLGNGKRVDCRVFKLEEEYFEGEYNDHFINVWKDERDTKFYIQVCDNKTGCYVYDGYAPDEDMSIDEAIVDAIEGGII